MRARCGGQLATPRRQAAGHLSTEVEGEDGGDAPEGAVPASVALCDQVEPPARRPLRRRRHPHPRPMRSVLPPLVPAPRGRGTEALMQAEAEACGVNFASCCRRRGSASRHEAPPRSSDYDFCCVWLRCCACGRRVHGDCGRAVTMASNSRPPGGRACREGGYLCPDCEDAEPTEGERDAARRWAGGGSARQRAVAVPLRLDGWKAPCHHRRKVLALYQARW